MEKTNVTVVFLDVEAHRLTADIIRKFSTNKKDIRNFYMELGQERNQAGFMLSEVLSTLSLLKKHMWEFALSRGMWQKTLDIYMALELDRRIVVFFDKAAFYTTKGYEGES